MGKRETYKIAIMNETIDERTGEVIRQAVVTEVIPGYIDVKVPRKGRFNNGDFITIFQNTMYRIATEAKLSKNELILLFYLLGTAGLDNSICTDLQILSEELNLDKGNISRSIKGLVKRNIVIRKDGYRGGGQKTLPMELSLKDYSKLKGIHPEVVTLPEKNEPKQLDLFDLIEEAEKGDKE